MERTAGIDEEFIGIRGPYLQALDIPNWSTQSWESFARNVGLNPLVRRAFSQIGFQRLYDFQERSVETVLEGDDTVITAATGRGKTEAWLIPILDQILEAKRGNHEDMEPDGVKATLIYPTKALAQDQLKRLIQYLYLINKELPKSDRITIGIYDGDTPTNPSNKAQGYLNTTFKYFECPGHNDSLEKCQNCGHGVHVSHTGQQYELQPEKPRCIDDDEHTVPLDFVRLTKKEILTEGVDILLTNPDTINLKLINVNAPDEHQRFIYEPKYLVFDEVHTYDGLFGSYTATLTKRIRALRASRDRPDLQVIASSATVENDAELFRKVSGTPGIAHVDEDPRKLDPAPVETPALSLYDEEYETTDILDYVRGKRDAPAPLANFSLPDIDPAQYDNDRLEDIVADALFDYLVNADTDDTIVQTIQNLHKRLAEQPRTRDGFIEELASAYDLSDAQATRLLSNFRTFGEFSGLLENRSHLFSWPIDGFYACVACDAVYRTPQDSCSNCEHGFVTRATYCRYGDDEASVAWHCPDCGQLEPYVPTEEGSYVGDDEQYCGRCESARDWEVRMNRITFFPELICGDCNSVQERSIAHTCNCGSPMTHLEPDRLQCTNPACEQEMPYSFECKACGGDELRPRVVDSMFECPDCGRDHDPTNRTIECDCGANVTSTRYLPWVCRNEECQRRHYSVDPPDSCGCGSSRTFAKRGFFEIFDDVFCENCDTALLPNGDCGCSDPERRPRSNAHKSFKTFDPDGKIRTVSSFRAAAPCQHSFAAYDDSRFDELVRSPNNLAVTTSQYLLRGVAGDEGYDAAKLLSFADSHRDMKELDRDFSEPEADAFLDQLVIAGIRSNQESSWVPFDSVLDGALEAIDNLHERLSPPMTVRDLEFSLKEELLTRAYRRSDVDDAIRRRLSRRTFPHRYSSQFGEFGGDMATDGLIDIRLREDLLDTLDGEERDVVRQLVDEGNDMPIDTFTSPSSTRPVEKLIDGLAAKGVLEERKDEEEYIRFDPGALEVAISGDGDGLQYVPTREQIEPSLHRQFLNLDQSTVAWDTSLSKCADPAHPRFSQRAYRVQYSDPRMLISRVYLGMTDKNERRELEFLFREGNYPNFLSSGPTMELGVDIGALDALLLYGTPPNMNAYLQRVGRAGRRSNSSLVHSVSQRNPIDYYYYDEPTALIQSDPKPVPLNEHNEEVLRVSLTWATLDYVAANFVIPWEIDGHGKWASVSGGDQFQHRGETDDGAEWGKFSHLMMLQVKELGLDSESTKLAALGDVVHDYRREIKDHLSSLLAYRYCTSCSRKYERSGDIVQCTDQACEGEVRDALDEYGHLIDEAVEQFEVRFLDHYRQYKQQLEAELVELNQKEQQKRRERRQAKSKVETSKIQREKDAIEDRRKALQNHLDEIERTQFMDFLRESPQSKFAFNMRSVSNTVGLTLVSESDGEYIRRPVSDNGGRAMQMAIKELHPGAAYLDDGQTYVVSSLHEDEYASADLREAVAATGHDSLAEEFVCPSCHATYSNPGAVCECGTDASLKRRRLVVPDFAEAYRDDLVMTRDGDPARAIYDKPNEEVQNTYAERDTSVLEFSPEQSFELATASGETLGTLEFGDYTILSHAENFRVKYQSGEMDPRATLFEVCGHEDCSGIVYRDDDDVACCSADPEHRPNRDEPSEFVRLGHKFDTEGIRVSLASEDLSHTFAHGLRVALQSLGGVSIREVDESIGDGYVDVFDAQEGGADVSKLLVEQREGTYRNFEHAIDLMQTHFACDCKNGCPSCLYQYGCDSYNRATTFERSELRDSLDSASIELVPTSDTEYTADSIEE
jgi:ATP-dependent helicase YprA (DUF1998 family)